MFTVSKRAAVAAVVVVLLLLAGIVSVSTNSVSASPVSPAVSTSPVSDWHSWDASNLPTVGGAADVLSVASDTPTDMGPGLRSAADMLDTVTPSPDSGRVSQLLTGAGFKLRNAAVMSDSGDYAGMVPVLLSARDDVRAATLLHP